MFARDDTEDPYRHVEYFEDVCATFNLSIFTEDEVKFKLFDKLLLIKLGLGIMIILFSIPMNGKHCLLSSLTLFFPETRSLGARWMITKFKTLPQESLYESY
jgi:hypothetical protein